MAKWEDSAHAKATIDLDTKKAKEYAAKLKISDPMKSDLCLSCHLTAHGVSEDRLLETFTGDQGIECEVCHGPGSLYLEAHKKKDRSMTDLFAKGLRPLQTKEQIRQLCAQCHEADQQWDKLKSSGHPQLDRLPFAEAAKKIAHPKPES